MKIKQFLPALMAAASLFSVSMVQAQNNQPSAPGGPHPGWHHGMGAEEHSNKLGQELNLTDDQKTKVQAVFEQMRQKIEAAVDAAKTNAETQLQGILTPDQYQKLQSMWQQHHGMGEHHHMGQGGGEGGGQGNNTGQ